MKGKIINIVKNFIVFIIILISYILFFSTIWIYKNFGNIGLEEISFQIRVPMGGANTYYYYNYAQTALPGILIATLLTFIIICLIFKKKKKYPKRMKGVKAEKSTALVVYKRFKIDKKYIGKLVCSFIVLIICVTFTVTRTDLITFVSKELTDSNLISEEYVEPNDVKIEFPEEKRNLIYIYLESMEATFYSKENGGIFEESLIEDLEELANENISFSTSNNIKGLYTLPGATWTTGAMAAQMTGLPLKIPIDRNSYGNFDSFLPGVTGIGDILKKQNYNQTLLIGSKATFGGRDHLFKQHGDFYIDDFVQATRDGLKTEFDYTWWGYTDTELFEYAKERLQKLSEKEEPFNFTMLTADTHAIDGYKCEDCEEKFNEQYFNVLNCSSKKVKEFVEWIQEQEFYDNTTIVICGDHPSMQPDTFDFLEDEGYIRTVTNIIINPAIELGSTGSKDGSTMDMFPTTLASMGVQIPGNKLGLGTNLFSGEQTLISKYGFDYVKAELEKNSKFYNTKFIYD